MNRLLLAGTALTAMSFAASAEARPNYVQLQELFGEPVTTSATGKPQRQSQVPASMTIIRGEEIRRSGVSTIPDILQNYAGIDVNRYATSQRDVTIRGANLPYNPRLLVLVNGRQVYLDHYGYTDWSLIGVEISEIRQIEVVRGPQSALFGFNAVAGVINIITVDPLAEQGVRARAGAGTDDTLLGSLTGAFALNDRVGVKLSGGYETTNEWAGIAIGTEDARRVNVSGEVTSKIADNVRATASYTFADSRQVNQAYAYGMFNVDGQMHGVNAVVDADTGLGLVKAQLFYNALDQELDSGVSAFGIKNDVLSVQLEDVFSVGTRHAFRIGTEYRRNEYRITGNDAGKTFYDVYAASGMWEWRPVESLTLTNAVRVDHLALGHGPINEPTFPRSRADYDRSYTEYSYNSAITLRLDAKTQLRANAARGIQAPSLNALGVAIFQTEGPFPSIVAGNPTLAPSVTRAYEVAFDRLIPAISGNFNVTASTAKAIDFLAASQNITFRFDPATFTSIITDEKLGNFRTYAVEVALDGRAMDVLDWAVNYTWTDVNEDLLFPDFGGFVPPEFIVSLNETVALEEGTPRHKVNVTLGYENDGWNAHIVGRYRSKTEQRATDPAAFMPIFIEHDDNITVDLKLGYTFENGIGLWAYGENLTKNDGAGLSIFDAERRFRAGVGYRF